MKSTIIFAAAALALTGCGTDRPRIAPPPAALMACADEPAAPDLPAKDGTEATQLVRDRLTLDYILAFRSAWGDCASKVAGLKAWADTVE